MFAEFRGGGAGSATSKYALGVSNDTILFLYFIISSCILYIFLCVRWCILPATLKSIDYNVAMTFILNNNNNNNNMLTSSSAAAERPRDASCLSVASVVQYVKRNILLLVTSASDMQQCTIKFCSVRCSRLC